MIHHGITVGIFTKLPINAAVTLLGLRWRSVVRQIERGGVTEIVSANSAKPQLEDKASWRHGRTGRVRSSEVLRDEVVRS